MAAAYLATPLRRVAAAAIDFTVALLLAVSAAAVTAAAIEFAVALQLAISAAAVIQQIRLHLLAIGIAAVLVFVSYHFCFLYYGSGQTPGRRVLSIQVVSSRPALGLALIQCVARPILRFLWLVAFFPLEYVSPVPWLTLVPLFVDLALMTFLPSRQTVADLICRTVVVNTPPPQPHRAPAGPMYSATDAEFGVPARPAGRP